MSENKELTIKEIQDKLSEPFPENQLEWRIQSGGVKDNKPWAMVLAYVSNRAIMERLDDVVGMGRWKNEYKPGPDGGVICGLSLDIEGEWLTKWDGAENTHVEPVKGGLSDAMKRAAVHFGIGRYLYKLKVGYANFVDRNGQYRTKINKDIKDYYNWNPPMLPDWALPEADQDPEEWAYKHEEIVKVARENGLSKSVIREAVIQSQFNEEKCISYLKQLMNKTM